MDKKSMASQNSPVSRGKIKATRHPRLSESYLAWFQLTFFGARRFCPRGRTCRRHIFRQTSLGPPPDFPCVEINHWPSSSSRRGWVRKVLECIEQDAELCSSASSTVTGLTSVTGSATVRGSATVTGSTTVAGSTTAKVLGRFNGLGRCKGLGRWPRARPPRLNICSSAPSTTQHRGHLTVPVMVDT